MKNRHATSCTYSIIVLLEENYDGFTEYIYSLDDIFLEVGRSYEIIIIANGKMELLRKILTKINPQGKLIAFAHNYKIPQAVCLRSAFEESCGDIIVVCGSYKQMKDDSLKKLIRSFDSKTDIISPWRQNRVDSKFGQLQSKIFNKMTQKVVGTELHDLSCTVRIFRRKVLEEIELYGNMYRFLPVIAAKSGFRTKEVPCEHYQERGKSGLYSLSEYTGRVIDIFTLYFKTHFIKKPLRFFSILGTVSVFIGFGGLLYVAIQKIICNIAIGGRPVIIMALLCIILGIQIASAGFLGEIIVFSIGRMRREYNIDKII